MSETEVTVREVVESPSWNQRVEAIRRIPDRHGQQEHRSIYAAVASRLYKPYLSPQFAFVEWRDDYESESFIRSYRRTVEATAGFHKTQPSEIAQALREAPEILIYQPPAFLRAMIECKQANDGGTARDKAARFSALRTEAIRLGGVALIAVVDGLGWERVNDALGPVVRDCDGRVFTLRSLSQMLELQELDSLRDSND